MASNYSQCMKWWTVTNEKGQCLIFSAVYADDVRKMAREQKPELFATGKLTVKPAMYATTSLSRGRFKRC